MASHIARRAVVVAAQAPRAKSFGEEKFMVPMHVMVE
jgi:hypothetical protein